MVKPLITIAQVDALPLGASVEIQAVATKRGSSEDKDRSSEDDIEGGEGAQKEDCWTFEWKTVKTISSSRDAQTQNETEAQPVTSFFCSRFEFKARNTSSSSSPSLVEAGPVSQDELEHGLQLFQDVVINQFGSSLSRRKVHLRTRLFVSPSVCSALLNRSSLPSPSFFLFLSDTTIIAFHTGSLSSLVDTRGNPLTVLVVRSSSENALLVAETAWLSAQS